MGHDEPRENVMKQCPHMPSCALFPLFKMQNALNVWQTMYCEGDHLRCARYQRAQEGRTSPLNLLPNGTTLTPPSKRGSDPTSSR
jgi:hypothetical protein